MDQPQTIIPLGKRKQLILLLGALAFVAIGAWMVYDPQVLNQAAYRNKFLIRAMGLLSVAFFSASAYFIARKIPKGEPGLIINANGFTDKSGALAVGWVPWSDVEDISVLNLRGRKLVMVQVKMPATYLNRFTGLQRKAMESNDRLFGTPVCISASGLQVSFEELLRHLKEGLERYRQL